ncbi:MAG: glycoside hydrolase family 44 protein [Anaeromyxobacter sp.]
MRVPLLPVVLALAACGAPERTPPPGDGGGGGGGGGGDLPAADVTVAVDTTTGRRAISPLVYGYNAGTRAEAPPGATWLRLGGNRWTAYSWVSNYSNAGSDWGPYSNDTFMGSPADGPAAAARTTLDDAKGTGVGVLVTIPMQGWVAKDAAGNVNPDGPLADHFVPMAPRKGAAFTLAPAAASTTVWADELANWCSSRWGAGAGLGFSLDNEPDLWSSTHREIQRTALTYAAFLSRSTEWAAALKDAVPGAQVFGPASYGWAGYVNLQGAPDAAGRDFLDFYLDGMKAASGGRRLLDALDLHFYSEAYGCGVRVNDATSAQRNSDCVVAARVQAPRSLHDAAYKEPSWITGCCTNGEGIRLLPRMLAKLDAHYPGTLLSISEYHHGGGDHVSGAVAQADALGALGRGGAHAAALWPLQADESWPRAAWRAYRNYDGEGHDFGDVSVPAVSTDLTHVSGWAAVGASDPDRVTVVLVHRPGATLDGQGNPAGVDGKGSRVVRVALTHARPLAHARAWRLEGGASPAWTAQAAAVVQGTVTLTLPYLSVTVLELTP